MMTLPISQLDKFGNNAPRKEMHVVAGVPECPEGEACRFGYTFDNGASLESLLYNKGSDILVVSLHGALNRKNTQLPRFERLATLLGTDYSALFVSDPSLYLDETLELAWFTGWEGYDLFPDLATLIRSAAEKVGAKRIILSGSSGGGFASLQLAPLIQGSVALAFNPQTDIHSYWQGGDPSKHGAERKYIEVVYPSAAPEGIWKINWDEDWTLNHGTIHSPVRRYMSPVECSVVYMNNKNDFHVEQHFEPFLKSLKATHQENLLIEHSYDGKEGHFPPNPVIFLKGLEIAVTRASDS